MDTNVLTAGVLVRGHPSSKRKVCVWDEAFTAYLSGDASSDSECYLPA